MPPSASCSDSLTRAAASRLLFQPPLRNTGCPCRLTPRRFFGVRRNLRGAFTCPHPEQLEGLHLALIDDVMTTGATLDEASRTLLAAGAASVQVWCVARTP